MTTREEKLAALETALAAAGAKDPAEAERFLIMWEVLVPFIPQSETTTQEPRATLMVDFQPTTEAQRTRVDELQKLNLALIREILV